VEARLIAELLLPDNDPDPSRVGTQPTRSPRTAAHQLLIAQL
jgi:hypothetical protein